MRLFLLSGVLLGCPGKNTGVDPRDRPEESDVETEDTDVDLTPQFEFQVAVIPEDIQATMRGITWTSDCPVSLNDLRMVSLTHWDFEGQATTGVLIVSEDAAGSLEGVFRTAFETGFAIEKMRPIVEFGGSDDASMAANNTSAFNCRKVTGGSSWSQHSYGDAIDFNPIQNPYVRGSSVYPSAGEPYSQPDQRDASVMGLLTDESPVVLAFMDLGWGWGGDWSSLKDYQHFSENGN